MLSYYGHPSSKNPLICSQFDLYRFLFHPNIVLYLLLHFHCTINEIMSESNSVEVQAMPTPVPMSFPTILRNSKLSDRYSYLRESETIIRDNTPSNNSVPKRKTREDKEGKRWVRRRENARFTGNPYVVFARPGSRDMQIDLPTAKKTFVSSPPYFIGLRCYPISIFILLLINLI